MWMEVFSYSNHQIFLMIFSHWIMKLGADCGFQGRSRRPGLRWASYGGEVWEDPAALASPVFVSKLRYHEIFVYTDFSPLPALLWVRPWTHKCLPEDGRSDGECGDGRSVRFRCLVLLKIRRFFLSNTFSSVSFFQILPLKTKNKCVA